MPVMIGGCARTNTERPQQGGEKDPMWSRAITSEPMEAVKGRASCTDLERTLLLSNLESRRDELPGFRGCGSRRKC
jgi:hypothetical protein